MRPNHSGLRPLGIYMRKQHLITLLLLAVATFGHGQIVVGHPNASEQKVMADELIDFISKNIKW